MKEELKKYIENYIKPEKENKSFSFMASAALKLNKSISYDYEDACMCECASSNLDNFLKNNKDKNKFQTV